MSRTNPERVSVTLGTFQHHLTAVLALLMAAAGAGLVLLSTSDLVKWLGLTACFVFLVTAADAITPRQFHIDRDGIRFRGAFRWQRWAWDELSHAETVGSTWFGRDTGCVQLVMASGRTVLLEESRTFHSDSERRASAVLAANVINSAIHDPRYRAALVGGSDEPPLDDDAH